MQDNQVASSPGRPGCTNCGEPVQGSFCASCGAPTGAGSAATGPGTDEPRGHGRRSTWMAVAAVSALVLLGVGAYLFARDDGDEEKVAVSTSTTTSTTTEPSATVPSTLPEPSTESTATAGPSLDDAVIAKGQFVSIAKQNCDPTMIPDPSQVSVESAGDGTFLVTDLEGNTFLFQQLSGTVTSTSGPDGALPQSYSFGCDATVFLGTLDN